MLRLFAHTELVLLAADAVGGWRLAVKKKPGQLAFLSRGASASAAIRVASLSPTRTRRTTLRTLSLYCILCKCSGYLKLVTRKKPGKLIIHSPFSPVGCCRRLKKPGNKFMFYLFVAVCGVTREIGANYC